MRTLAHRIGFACAFAVVGSGCFLFDQEAAVSLGVIHVEEVLVEDTCGPGFQAPGPSLAYDVELRRTGTTLMWAGPGAPVQGTCDDSGRFCFELTNTWHVRDPDPWLEDPGCDMFRVERLCGSLEMSEDATDAGSKEQVTAVTATHESFVSSAAGSYCPELIGVQPGQFMAIPCQVAYEITGAAAE
jgi:hypothetical protein